MFYRAPCVILVSIGFLAWRILCTIRMCVCLLRRIMRISRINSMFLNILIVQAVWYASYVFKCDCLFSTEAWRSFWCWYCCLAGNIPVSSELLTRNQLSMLMSSLIFPSMKVNTIQLWSLAHLNVEIRRCSTYSKEDMRYEGYLSFVTLANTFAWLLQHLFLPLIVNVSHHETHLVSVIWRIWLMWNEINKLTVDVSM